VTCKVLVCRVGEEPKVEEVENPFKFCQMSLIGGGYIEAKLIVVNDKSRVVAYWDEADERKNLPFNRNIPVRALPPAITPNFVVDTRKGPPEMYAKPGELGYFAIRGNFLITKADNNGDHISLNDEEIQTLSQLLAIPKCLRCGIHPPAYPGAKYCGAACSQEAEIQEP